MFTSQSGQFGSLSNSTTFHVVCRQLRYTVVDSNSTCALQSHIAIQCCECIILINVCAALPVVVKVHVSSSSS